MTVWKHGCDMLDFACSLENYFIKEKEDFFHVFIALFKHSGGLEEFLKVM